MAQDWIKDLTQRYTQKIAHSSLPSAPQSSQFASELANLSLTPLVYESQSLLDEALEVLPLELLFAQAEIDINHDIDNKWGHQDYLIQALVKWFKSDFFTWITVPPCPTCNEPSQSLGAEPPLPVERSDGAGRVEIFQCPRDGTLVRFPRYGHPRKLLTFRKGRCGEWANCFTLLCRALGSRARWIWNAEDHVWTEVFSETHKRWIHVDPCEAVWDQPRLYEQGWGKKMSYVIAFSAEGAVDVSNRYVRNPDSRLARNRISEHDLVNLLSQISFQRRKKMTSQEKTQLEIEDQNEQEELNSYTTSPQTQTQSEILKPRQTGAGAWTHTRGEDGK
ncbi:hypothetical protein V1514DRAFT_344896 [Lipomyces japonicus]|uniref:uncharacterized protein n=1 Tax=Lipomyces japonicus TaxID=56871 RepID=UPI0034CFA2B6